MRIFGLEIARTKAASAVSDSRGWFGLVRESFTGAWQRNVEVKPESVLAFHAVFSCMTLIASDIAKMRVKFVAMDADGIWNETTSPAYSPVLRKPNDYQNRIQFWENWMLSKLSRGNTYVLKQRDARNVVTKLFVLDPNRVTPLVSDSGDVFYQLSSDNLIGFPTQVTVPAREIIHDRFNCLFHPLVGISPIYASGLAATQGLHIQNNSATFFANGSRPGGVLTAPGNISQETADRLKSQWEENYTGENAGKTAILGNGLKYEALTATPKDAELIEQLRWTAEVVCSTFHVPPYKLGIGAVPANSNVEGLNLEYYTQCLQILIEAAELCLDEGLETPANFGTEFDTDNLLRMDTAALMKAMTDGTGAGILKLDEARAKLGVGKMEGGDTAYLQQQNFSVRALAERDRNDPFAKPAAPAAPDEAAAANDNAEEQRAKALLVIVKGLS